MEHRQHPRFPLRMPVRCESTAPPRYRTLGMTQNVSRGGLLLETAQPMARGTWLGLRFLTEDRIARAEAVVVWMANGSPGRMGLRFTMMSEAHFLAWEQLLAVHGGLNPRASLRVPVDLEIDCVVPPDTSLHGRATDLSDGGMSLVLPRAVPLQTRVSLSVPAWLFLPPTEAEVVWTRAASKEQGVVHGLRFLERDVGRKLFRIGSFLRRYLD